MAVTRTDLLAVDFVLVGAQLLSTTQEVADFGHTEDEVTVAPLRQGETPIPDGKRLRIDKKRINIDLFADRSRVRQEYPSESDLPALAHLVTNMLQHSKAPLDNVRAHGYNIDLSYDQDSAPSAYSYISKRIFGTTSPIEHWHIVGGNGAMRLVGGDGVTRNINIEPRFQDETTQRVFLTFNLHFGGSHIPPGDEIARRLSQVLEEAKAFIEALDREG